MTPDPMELAAAVLAGWFIAWLASNIGVPPLPTTIIGLVVWASTYGKYRHRWAAGPGRPEPGS
jgi:hypothetical protein